MKWIIVLITIILFADDKVFIKGGEYIIPKGDSFFIYNYPKTKIKLDSFYIDKYEITYEDVANIDISLVPTYIDIEMDRHLAVNTLSYKEAEFICKKRGGDLPTEEQWIVAASFDTKFHKYPVKFNIDDYVEDIVFVDELPKGVNGLYGMLGNVWEMTKSSGKLVLVKGGSFFDYDKEELLDVRIRNYVLKKDVKLNSTIGFRCVYKDNK